MVPLHHVDGKPFFLNADLIECIDEDDGITVVSLMDGRLAAVLESAASIVALVTRFRGEVLAAADSARRPGGPGLSYLSLVTDD